MVRLNGLMVTDESGDALPVLASVKAPASAAVGVYTTPTGPGPTVSKTSLSPAADGPPLTVTAVFHMAWLGAGARTSNSSSPLSPSRYSDGVLMNSTSGPWLTETVKSWMPSAVALYELSRAMTVKVSAALVPVIDTGPKGPGPGGVGEIGPMASMPV